MRFSAAVCESTVSVSCARCASRLGTSPASWEPEVGTRVKGKGRATAGLLKDEAGSSEGGAGSTDDEQRRAPGVVRGAGTDLHGQTVLSAPGPELVDDRSGGDRVRLVGEDWAAVGVTPPAGVVVDQTETLAHRKA